MSGPQNVPVVLFGFETVALHFPESPLASRSSRGLGQLPPVDWEPQPTQLLARLDVKPQLVGARGDTLEQSP